MNISFSGIKGTAIKKDGTEIKFETNKKDSTAEVKRDCKDKLTLKVYEWEFHTGMMLDMGPIERSLIKGQKKPEPIEIQSVVFDKIDNSSSIDAANLKKGDVMITELNKAKVYMSYVTRSEIEIKKAVDAKLNEYNISGNDLFIKLPHEK